MIRDQFKQARKHNKAIIFIDEVIVLLYKSVARTDSHTLRSSRFNILVSLCASWLSAIRAFM
jgi:ATP-dependent Zn protease